MRPHCFVTAAALGGLLLAPPATPSQQTPAIHDITCASPVAERQYQEGLARFHQGRWHASARDFEQVLRRDPRCAMARWGLSRALAQLGRRAEALAAAIESEKLATRVDDRENRLVTGWAKYLRALEKPEAEREKPLEEVRRELSVGIAVYPDEVELWLLRASAAESPLRAAPFTLAALRLQPRHPIAAVWKPEVPPLPQIPAKATRPVQPLAEAPKLFDGLGSLHYRVTTISAEAQAYFEQGLRCYHSYVMPAGVKNGASACFRHAAALDPDCAMAYWGLSFCGDNDLIPLDAAHRALELASKHGTDRERRLCAARVLELEARALEEKARQRRPSERRDGEAEPKAGPPAADPAARAKRELFLDTLDGAIAAYPDDVEIWIWRGKVYGDYFNAAREAMAIPYQLAAHRLRPAHPAPNHELVHLYEAIERPAIGWPYTIGYRRSAPNMPHANHMQGHLAMRLGRWDMAVDCTRASRRKAKDGYPELDSNHHVDTMLIALSRQGHFREAEAEPAAYRDALTWARLLQLKADLQGLDQWAIRRRESKSPDGFYVGALAALDRGDLAAVSPLLANVEEHWKKNTENLYRHHEVKGRLQVQSGQVDEGLKLLREAAAKVVKDSGAHAWGGGSYILEVWGESALRVGRLAEAEEAFLEALAHEHGSVIGAIGLQVVCERRGDRGTAAHYAARAAAIWQGADLGALDRQLARIRELGGPPVGTVPGMR